MTSVHAWRAERLLFRDGIVANRYVGLRNIPLHCRVRSLPSTLCHSAPVPSQPSLRPFDIAVALRLVLVPEDRYEPLAGALATSTSAVHRSVARLQHAGICGPGSRTVREEALHEFLVHGVRYAFPPVHGPERVGLPTAGSHPDIAAAIGDGEALRPMIWPSDSGTVRGETLVPLFNGLTKVASKDARLHAMLACVDALRVGTPTQRTAAAQLLRRQLANARN